MKDTPEKLWPILGVGEVLGFNDYDNGEPPWVPESVALAMAAAALEQAILAVSGCDRVSDVQPALRKLMKESGDE